MIETENLTKDYGPIRAVDDVTFEVKKGDILGFLGPNGAGKSTTMKMITGFLPPTAGTARIGGHDILEAPIEAKRLLGYLPENGPLYGEMTVLEFLNFIAEMRGYRRAAAKAARIAAVTEICHLEGVGYQPIETLSKGYRQRVGMAQAVIHDPPYLIMDEPTDGLDPNQKQAVRRLIASMAEDKAIILSTHILEEVESMCNRVAIIARGRILVDESPDDLRKRHRNYNAIRLSVPEADARQVMETLGNLEAVKQVVEDHGGILAIPARGEILEKLILSTAHEHGWKLTKVEKAPTRLDEVFRELTEGA